jgi:hypothetical protein
MLERIADQAEKVGNRQSAAELRNRAREILHGFTDIGLTCEAAHQSTPDSAARTAKLDNPAAQARQVARLGLYDPEGVRVALADGSEGERMAALTIMEVQPDIANLDVLRSAIAEPRSVDEQRQAMRAVKALVPGLPDRERQDLRDFMEVVRRSTKGARRDPLVEDIIRLV